jgi:hypothetical protein
MPKLGHPAPGAGFPSVDYPFVCCDYGKNRGRTYPYESFEGIILMIRILLLDCPPSLTEKLKKQGYDVEAGTVGFATGMRTLPSQVYEKHVFFYSPTKLAMQGGRPIEGKEIEDYSPEYNLEYLTDTITRGATFVVFVNRVIDDIKGQNLLYRWIPFMPAIQFTKDKQIGSNHFEHYPDDQCRFLAPVVDANEVEIPVLQKLLTPARQEYPRDIFTLFANANGEQLGVLINRGRGYLVVLPRFKSNEQAITTFVQRVLPRMYESGTRTGLLDKYVAPNERDAQVQVTACEAELAQIEEGLEQKRIALAAAKRSKENVILQDPTAKQILNYYETALRQDDVALFYLYKAVELIENNHGGESGAIKKFGVGSEWKFLKKLANASYADIRHAPKPGDVMQQWTDEDIDACFDAVEKIVHAYFASLFP